MNNNQTAVEWFVDQLPLFIKNMYADEIIECKSMEKEQIKEGYIMALLDRDTNVRRDAEDYYNETYKGVNNGQ